jgi:outer membrane lipopolysaccharide assembly protein LptE/RlpB
MQRIGGAARGLGLGLWILAAAGCGYAPLSTTSLPAETQRLHVAPVKNETFRPGLEGAVTAAMLRQFRQDGRVQLVAAEAASGVLAARITAYENLPITFTVFDVGSRYRVRVWLALQLTGHGQEKPVLEEQVAGEAYYNTGASVVLTRTAEEDAIQRAVRDLAAQVVARVLDIP